MISCQLGIRSSIRSGLVAAAQSSPGSMPKNGDAVSKKKLGQPKNRCRTNTCVLRISARPTKP